MKVLVADIGGTYLKYAYMDENGAMLARGKRKTPQEGREQLVDALAQLYGAEPGVEAIALSMPGIIDSQNGYCAMGGALRYNDGFALGEALARRCPAEIFMANDARCAAMAECTMGSLKDVADGFVLLFGTMIGGCYIKDHQPQLGRHFSAGEVSYIATLRDGLPTTGEVWGNRCGASGLCRLYAKAKGLPPESVDGVQVFEAVGRGDPEAAACLRQFAREIAVQIFNLQTVLDPERFAIGGGISAQPALLEAIRAALEELYAACPYQVPRAQVVCCQFQNDANLYGALRYYLAQREGRLLEDNAFAPHAKKRDRVCNNFGS